MSGVRILRVDLEPDLAEDLEKVRKHLGLRNESEVIRFLIREKAREIQPVTPVTAEGEAV